MAALEIELGPQSLATIRALTEALKGLKGTTAAKDNAALNELMTRKQAAKFLGVSPTTLGEWVRNGDIPEPIELSERNQRWQKSDLMEFAKRRGAA